MRCSVFMICVYTEPAACHLVPQTIQMVAVHVRARARLCVFARASQHRIFVSTAARFIVGEMLWRTHTRMNATTVFGTQERGTRQGRARSRANMHARPSRPCVRLECFSPAAAMAAATAAAAAGAAELNIIIASVQFRRAHVLQVQVHDCSRAGSILLYTWHMSELARPYNEQISYMHRWVVPHSDKFCVRPNMIPIRPLCV